MQSPQFQTFKTEKDIIFPLNKKHSFCSVCKISIQSLIRKIHFKERHKNHKEICPIRKKCF